jgi:hypothetical protein
MNNFASNPMYVFVIEIAKKFVSKKKDNLETS